MVVNLQAQFQESLKGGLSGLASCHMFSQLPSLSPIKMRGRKCHGNVCGRGTTGGVTVAAAQQGEARLAYWVHGEASGWWELPHSCLYHTAPRLSWDPHRGLQSCVRVPGQVGCLPGGVFRHKIKPLLCFPTRCGYFIAEPEIEILCKLKGINLW